MLVHEIFAHIFEDEVKNIIVCENYPTADYLAKCVYGSSAFAVDCLQYRCQIGDKYHDGQFWHINEETGLEEAVPYEPTDSQKVEILENELSQANLALSFVASSFTDEQAVQVQSLYPEWKSNDETIETLSLYSDIDNNVVSIEYKVGQRLNYKGHLYKVLINHFSNKEMTPDVATELYEKLN